MFLLNYFWKYYNEKEKEFTIQNVPIKYLVLKLEYKGGTTFTIKNVPIKLKLENSSTTTISNLQYRMFLLNKGKGQKGDKMNGNLQYRMFLLNK